tara:strand:+ start:616 stop:846 length:231 start_codon:yes stop_codon:yes gene_type:complete
MAIKLKFKTQKVIELGHWNYFVSKVYGRPYDFQQQNGGRGKRAFGINVPEEYDMILNDLHLRGLLEGGEYLINIDW